jgi:hypothetical protein
VDLLPLHGAVVELGNSLLLHHHTCTVYAAVTLPFKLFVQHIRGYVTLNVKWC